jgi:hypothetical protein
MLTATFEDARIEEEISSNGYVHIPKFLSKDELSYLYNLYLESHEGSDQGTFWNSMMHLPTDKGKEIRKKIISVMQPRFEQVFTEVSMPIIYFVSKSAAPLGSICPPHRDDSIFDESQNRYRNIWIPLVDTSIDNGTLFVLPKSHKIFTEQLPTMAKWPYAHFDQSLERQYHAINAKAGDLVVYLDNAIHGSYINSTSVRRPVIHGGIIHKSSSDNVQFHILNNVGEIEIYGVSIDFFINKEFMDPDFKTKYPLIEVRKYDNSGVVTLERFEEFYSSGSEV